MALPCKHHIIRCVRQCINAELLMLRTRVLSASQSLADRTRTCAEKFCSVLPAAASACAAQMEQSGQRRHAGQKTACGRVIVLLSSASSWTSSASSMLPTAMGGLMALSQLDGVGAARMALYRYRRNRTSTWRTDCAASRRPSRWCRLQTACRWVQKNTRCAENCCKLRSDRSRARSCLCLV